MTTYHVSIKLEGKWAENFKMSDTRLCMAKAVKEAGGKERFNIIAITSPVEQANIAVTWTDEYQIGATTQLFTHGATITGAAISKDITFGCTYDMQSWTDVNVISDNQDVHKDQIGFRNAVMCSALISIKSGSEFVPIYVSPATLPPGKTIFTPLPKVAFWWSSSAKTSTMINVFTGEAIYVNPTPEKTANLVFTEDGHWKQN